MTRTYFVLNEGQKQSKASIEVNKINQGGKKHI